MSFHEVCVACITFYVLGLSVSFICGFKALG